MDPDSSTKFIGSLTKFLQSLCNGYVEFEDGVELIGHIYLSVDGKSGKKIDYILNEKVCKSDNSVTFISNSFHALPEAKAKAASGKEGDAKKDDGEVSDSGDSIPKSTNTGTIPSRASQSSRSAPSPTQNRSGVQTGTKRPGSPLKGPTPPQRRAPTPPSQRRIQTSAAKGSAGSPASKTVPSSPSSSSQDNIPSPSPARKNRIETSQPPSNQSDNAGADNESDSLVPPNIMSINPPPDFASFLGSLTSDNQTSARDQRSPQRDTKPDTDVTFIKEEFVSEPSSCAQAGSSGQHSGRSGDEHLDSSGLYPVMLHQNTSVFPSTSAGYPPGFPGGASATATSQQPGFPGTSTSQSDLFNPVPGTSQDGADPSGVVGFLHPSKQQGRSFRNYNRLTTEVGLLSKLPASQEITVEYEVFEPDADLNCESEVVGAFQQYDTPASGEEGTLECRVAGGGSFREGGFQCLVCGKCFAQAGTLNRHFKLHAGGTVFVCSVCGSKFNRNDNLIRHKRFTHGACEDRLRVQKIQ